MSVGRLVGSKNHEVRFHVFTAAIMEMTVFWNVALCSLVDVSEVLAASIIRAMMEAASTSETSINFYQTTRPTSQKTVILINYWFPVT
jgi:hypothetical protein